MFQTLNRRERYQHLVVEGQRSRATIAGSVIDSVDEFKYLGSMINMNDSSANETRILLAIARGIISDLSAIWQHKDRSEELKTRCLRFMAMANNPVCELVAGEDK